MFKLFCESEKERGRRDEERQTDRNGRRKGEWVRQTDRETERG